MTITVVAAVIERDGRLLVTRRQAGVHLAGMWEFPGGKVAPGETHEAALQREIQEELAAAIVVGELEHHTRHEYDDRTVVLYFYRSALVDEPTPLLGQEMRWVTRQELPALGFPPADAELVARLAAI